MLTGKGGPVVDKLFFLQTSFRINNLSSLASKPIVLETVLSHNEKKNRL